MLLMWSFSLAAQNVKELMEEGGRLEKEFKIEAALSKYESVLKSDPNHIQALIHASRMVSNIGGHLKGHDQRKPILVKAEAYSMRAIQLDPLSTDAHFSLIVTLGLQAESAASPREKLKDAKSIRTEAETILHLDSTYALAYFVLGKWHQELSKLNWFEKLACELFFGGLPEGISIDKAVFNFQQALRLDPENILFMYGQAIAFQYKGQKAEAIRLLEKALTMPLRDPDDLQRKARCETLLKELK